MRPLLSWNEQELPEDANGCDYMDPRLNENSFAKRASAPVGQSLRSNFFWTFTGNLVYAACQWGILVVLAKLGSPEMVGEFALALAITAPVLIGAGLNLRAVQASDALETHPFSHYLWLRLVTTACALVAIGVIVFVSGYSTRTASVVMIVACAKAAEALSDIFYGGLQRQERMTRIAFSMMIKGILSLVVVTLGLYLTRDLVVACVALVAVWTLTLLFYDVPSGLAIATPPSGRSSESHGLFAATSLLTPVPTSAALYTLTGVALPVGIVMLLIALNGNAPRYFIERAVGLRELGIFAAMIYPMQAGTTVIAALGQSALPRLARFYASGDPPSFRSLLFRMAGIALIVGCGGIILIWLAGQQILTLLYTREYAEHKDVFLFLGFSAALGYTGAILGYGMTAARYFRAQLPVFATVTVVTIVASLLLIPRYRLTGAAFVLIAAALVQCAGSILVIQHALAKFRDE